MEFLTQGNLVLIKTKNKETTMNSKIIKALTMVLLVALIAFFTAPFVEAQETKTITKGGKEFTYTPKLRPEGGPPATWTVTSNADAGANTLRWAISNSSDGDNIIFDILGSDVITLTTQETLFGGGWNSAFALIGKSITINGTNTNLASGNNITVQVSGTATPSFRIFTVVTNNTLTLQNIILKDGAPPSDDGGLMQLQDGHAILTNTTLSNGTGKVGGAIWCSTTLTIDNSTISGNTATSNGGGIYLAGAGSGLTMTNSTVSGNTCTQAGGGINAGGSTVIIQSSTIANNRCDDNDSQDDPAFPSGEPGGGLFTYLSGSLTIENTIIANNLNGTASPVGDDYYRHEGTLTDNGYNVVKIQSETNPGAQFNNATDILYNTKADGTTGYSTWNQGNTDLGNQNLNLSTALTDNGTTKTGTLDISAGSFAIGAGIYVAAADPDQIGTVRIDPPTIGAYEYISAAGVLITESGSTDVAEGGASPQDSYTVELTTAPTAAVTVTVTPERST